MPENLYLRERGKAIERQFAADEAEKQRQFASEEAAKARMQSAEQFRKTFEIQKTQGEELATYRESMLDLQTQQFQMNLTDAVNKGLLKPIDAQDIPDDMEPIKFMGRSYVPSSPEELVKAGINYEELRKQSVDANFKKNLAPLGKALLDTSQPGWEEGWNAMLAGGEEASKFTLPMILQRFGKETDPTKAMYRMFNDLQSVMKDDTLSPAQRNQAQQAFTTTAKGYQYMQHMMMDPKDITNMEVMRYQLENMKYQKFQQTAASKVFGAMPNQGREALESSDFIGQYAAAADQLVGAKIMTQEEANSAIMFATMSRGTPTQRPVDWTSNFMNPTPTGPPRTPPQRPPEEEPQRDDTAPIGDTAIRGGEGSVEQVVPQPAEPEGKPFVSTAMPTDPRVHTGPTAVEMPQSERTRIALEELQRKARQQKIDALLRTR